MTLTVTGPSIVGVTTTVYVSPSIELNAPRVPFDTLMSLASKPVTASLNWNVNVVEAAFVSVPSGEMVSVGPVVSTVQLRSASPDSVFEATSTMSEPAAVSVSR